MNNRVKRHYKRLREKGWPAKSAFDTARAKALFEDLEHAGLARLRVEPDDDYDFSHLDDRDCNTEEQANAERARISRLGVWGVIVEVRNPLSGEDGPWEHLDSCWGFVGDDWEDSGYDTDWYQNAIDWIAQFEGMAA